MDNIVKLAESFQEDRGEMGKLYKDFCADHDLEKFETYEALVEYWSQEGPFECLRSGSYGKLNYLYTYKILLEHREAFDKFLYRFAAGLVKDISLDDTDAFLQQCREVVRFGSLKSVEITKNLNVVDSKRAVFTYDVLSWKEGSTGHLQKDTHGSVIEYEFYLPDRQREALARQCSQFFTGDLNAALRQMSVDTDADQFFYRVKRVGTSL